MRRLSTQVMELCAGGELYDRWYDRGWYDRADSRLLPLLYRAVYHHVAIKMTMQHKVITHVKVSKVMGVPQIKQKNHG
jgi:hypothetical protein